MPGALDVDDRILCRFSGVQMLYLGRLSSLESSESKLGTESESLSKKLEDFITALVIWSTVQWALLRLTS